ncbi:MAG TPA: ABC transporter substrate-binding protein, partial [Firmicutes bacterium]|nr:ABC transporter substrate-binding protein [Bacillota bacterium]
MKKVWCLAVLLFLLVSSVSGLSAKKTVINYWTHTDDNRTRIENRYIAEFEKMNPNVEIKRVVNEASKMGDIVLTAFAANNGPDIFNLPIEQEYGYIYNQRVAAVDYQSLGYKNLAALQADYAPNTFEPVTMNKKIYGLPLEL